MHFEIIVGSVLGASEYVADAVQEALETRGFTAEIHLEPDVNQINETNPWLLITSTHGAGDLPDNIQPFAEQLDGHKLSNKFMIIGLGDTSYDTFCYGSIQIQEKLEKAGCQLMAKPLHIDVLQHPVPEELAVEWLESTLDEL